MTLCVSERESLCVPCFYGDMVWIVLAVMDDSSVSELELTQGSERTEEQLCCIFKITRLTGRH